MDTPGRLTAAASLSLLPLLPLSARLAQLQVMQHRSLESRASGEFQRSALEVVPRADILDRRGKILAQSLPTWSAFVDRAMAKDARALAARLARVLRLPEAEVLRRIRSGPRFAWVKTRMGYEESQALAQERLESVGIVPGEDRFYPNEDLARGVLGLVGGQKKGLSGVELAFDARLTGKARRLEYIRDGSGQTIYKSAGGRAERPAPLRLTLDRNIQYFAEEALREAAAQSSIRGGLVAVQDPSSGEILALASYPSDPLKVPAVQDTYEPGSTFKIVTAAAALEDKLVSDEESFFCENGSFEVAPGVVIHDHEPAGDLTLGGILAESSNIGIAKVAARVGALRFYRMSRALGFASKTGVGLPGETAGELKPLSDLTPVHLAASSYGYGVGASALQVLSAYSAVAAGGVLHEPKLVLDGKPPARVRRAMSERAAAALTRMLEGVVERGTGMPARVPGWRVAGKTGTSRKLDRRTGKYSQSQYTASFAGFLPAGAPRWTVLVVIDEPKGAYYGAQVAAPVFGKLALRLLSLHGVPPDAPAPVALSLPALVPAARGRR